MYGKNKKVPYSLSDVSKKIIKKKLIIINERQSFKMFNCKS